MSHVLLADIGGSTSRFAYANSGGRPERVLAFANDTFGGIEAAVARYLGSIDVRPHAAVLAVAGPVDGDEIALTNRAWQFRLPDLGARFGLAPVHAINDFEALAWALPHLRQSDTRPLGTAGQAPGVKVVLGPGTGLGVAALVPAGSSWQVVASEGGHASFGPGAPEEEPVFARLRAECGHVSRRDGVVRPGAHAVAPRIASGRDAAQLRGNCRKRPRRRTRLRAQRSRCSCGCSAVSPATLRSPSRRPAASMSAAALRSASARCSTAGVPRRIRGAPALPDIARRDPDAPDHRLRRAGPARLRGDCGEAGARGLSQAELGERVQVMPRGRPARSSRTRRG